MQKTESRIGQRHSRDRNGGSDGKCDRRDTVTLKFAMAVQPSHCTATAAGKFFMDRAVALSK